MRWWNVNRRGDALDQPLTPSGTALGEDAIALLEGALVRVQDSYFQGVGRPPSERELDFLWRKARSPAPIWFGRDRRSGRL